MTEKQQNIINSGLELFATKGFDSTSTNAIAKNAGVSEGLIFRHFNNKEGLLEAIIQMGMEKANQYFSLVMLEEDPRERIKMALSLPAQVEKEEYNFWRLTYSLKWQRGTYEDAAFEAFTKSMVDAFEQLGYSDPKSEAKLIEVFIDGIATELLLKDSPDPTPLLNSLLAKYELIN
ncbi:MAG: AcrR family transcriptional regulator [Flavobacteriaceae bacterium]